MAAGAPKELHGHLLFTLACGKLSWEQPHVPADSLLTWPQLKQERTWVRLPLLPVPGPPRHRWAHPNMWHLLRVQRAAMAAPWSWAQGLMCAPPLQRHRSWQPSCLQPNSAEPCGAEDHSGPSTESTPGQRPSCRDAAAGSQIISAVGIQHPPPCSGSALPPHHLPLLFLAWQGSGTLAAL